ncbi:4-(cytidine 5'-diphospho)-2-C-methyl-D-erythritol kinase [Synechococcus sp. L2F]|uniref:4-(cytidine 5'-diphospho)-2-C-methyl-D-erythritol kinase n=1 Tax=Synechococcus sp. L2F TaxID=2823739 RepID=UPI0020CCDDBA|nr:4-(cytidine 5'-diphospho)-2-C-methyl-D-erythritol kinase [Synechococcus sp. L2F]MCP9829431.1 4-(cytidine 5'-diphospho)-2-C-methyl-D-erythritol kinase [Synechococcus sp. L2F]
MAALSRSLTVLAPAKINLHLEVLGLRPDGFHELAMLMQSIDLEDRLVLHERDDGRLQLSCDRPGLPTDGTNLISRAALLLQQRLEGPLRGADIHLEKRIPIGAGLAGGSSDAAAALVGLHQLWNMNLPPASLLELAAELGSDVPFCLAGGSQLCFGRGEQLEPVPAAADPLAVLLIKDPAVSVSTPWAYGRCRELRGDFYLDCEADFEQRREHLRGGPLLAALRGERGLPPLRNDLQAVVEPEQASVREGLALMRGLAGTLGVAMSGSGPSLFALFSNAAEAAAAQQQLAPALQAAGFDAWCCRFTPAGARVISDQAMPPAGSVPDPDAPR